MSQFAMVPVEAIQDKRLTGRQFKVLCALLSIADDGVGEVWAKRETIARRAGVHVSHVSAATSSLVKFGWIEKHGEGGFSKPACYIVKQTCAVLAHVNDATTYAKTAQLPTPKQRRACVAPKQRRAISRPYTQTKYPDRARLQQIKRALDRLPFQLDQANPIVAAIADELGVPVRAGQTTFEVVQQIRREIESVGTASREAA